MRMEQLNVWSQENVFRVHWKRYDNSNTSLEEVGRGREWNLWTDCSTPTLVSPGIIGSRGVCLKKWVVEKEGFYRWMKYSATTWKDFTLNGNSNVIDIPIFPSPLGDHDELSNSVDPHHSYGTIYNRQLRKINEWKLATSKRHLLYISNRNIRNIQLLLSTVSGYFTLKLSTKIVV